MKSLRVPFKQDDFGNEIFARVSWSESTAYDRPIALAYHAGGFLVGSSEMIPQAEVEYLSSKGFVVVAPNYRLCPQVTGRQAMQDCEEAYDWAATTLPAMMSSQHGVGLDPQNIVALGHSAGGSIAMHIGATRSLKAVTALYPTLYCADKATALLRPFTAPPFGAMPDFAPSTEQWAEITPASVQVAEASLTVPGSVPPPRNRWQAQLLHTGMMLSALCPDGDYTSVDPMTKVKATWPPTMILQGDADCIPGSGLDLARRAERDMKAAGVPEVSIVVAEEQDHMFDLRISPADAQWPTVVRGLDWLVDHV